MRGRFYIPEGYMTISQVAQKLGISNNTIKRWYAWYENDEYHHPEALILPKYHHYDARGTKFFAVTDIALFERFQQLINSDYRGVMAEYNKKHNWRNERTCIIQD